MPVYTRGEKILMRKPLLATGSWWGGLVLPYRFRKRTRLQCPAVTAMATTFKNTGGYQERPRKKKRKLVSKKSRGKHTGINLPVTSAKKTRTM
jgi:hypothetical protein